MRVVMIIEMSWQVNEEVSQDMTGEADGKNPGVDSTTDTFKCRLKTHQFQAFHQYSYQMLPTKTGAFDSAWLLTLCVLQMFIL